MPPVRLRPPNRFSTLTFPVFGMSWYGNPGSGDNIVAYCGGGGSAKTGVTNKIVVILNGIEELEISTGDDVAVAVQVYEHPKSRSVCLLAAVGKTVQRYALPSGDLMGTVDVGDSTNALGVHVMGEAFAVGCENGDVHVCRIHQDTGKIEKMFLCQGHTKSVCSIQFAQRALLFVSSAKDGTARVWKQGGECLAVLKCDVRSSPNAPPPRRPLQVMVRGTAFGDIDAKVVYTVASAKRGTAYLTRWIMAEPGKYVCEVRTPVHEHPISAMNLSKDGALMAMGGADGTVYIFDVGRWKVLRKFKEIHDLPVTCIGARPFPCPLRGDGEVPMHALSASADSKLANLTLVKRAPKKASSGEVSKNDSGFFLSILWMLLLCYVLYLIYLETMEICVDSSLSSGFDMECFLNEVLIAPPTRQGVAIPPY